jgi:Phosphotransferase enzyme family
MSVPATLEEAVSPRWLGGVLGLEVVGVNAGPVDERVSTNVPIRLDLADGSTRELWIKGYFSAIGRNFRHAGVSEAMFYRELAGWVGVRTLQPVYAEVDPVTQANVVVTQDVLGHRAVFLNARSVYTADQVAASLEQLAVLHSSTWLHPVGTASWLTSRFSSYTIARGVADIATNFDGPIGARVPEAVRDADRLYEVYKMVAEGAAKASPWSVIHGDPHIGNVFLDGEGRPCFLDWQLVQRGPWYLDVGYHLASSLTVEDRQRHEDDLVAHYLDRMAAAGVGVPSAGDAWRGLRRGFLHGFYLWSITLKVEPAITSELLERLGTAVDDHNALKEVSN